MASTRSQVVGQLARLVAGRASRLPGQVFRVAVTGITASGKSTLAEELMQRLEGLGRSCIRLPVDGFHNARSVRYRLGRDSAEGYYRHAYNYDLLLSRVLVPLGPGGDRFYVDRVFDVETDTPIAARRIEAPAGCIAVFDASFLLRPEIRDHFDYRVFVQVSYEAARVRGVMRDSTALGGEKEAERLYRQRYHAAQQIYFSEANPLQFADALFINEHVEAPQLFIRAGLEP